MEAGAPNRDKNAGCMKTALKITRNVLFNPVVASTILGLLYKVVINEPLPDVVEITLKTMGNAFAVGALFGLGMFCPLRVVGWCMRGADSELRGCVECRHGHGGQDGCAEGTHCTVASAEVPVSHASPVVCQGSKLVLPMLLTLIKALLLPILVRSILVAFGTSDEDKLNFSYVCTFVRATTFLPQTCHTWRLLFLGGVRRLVCGQQMAPFPPPQVCTDLP